MSDSALFILAVLVVLASTAVILVRGIRHILASEPRILPEQDWPDDIGERVWTPEDRLRSVL